MLTARMEDGPKLEVGTSKFCQTSLPKDFSILVAKSTTLDYCIVDPVSFLDVLGLPTMYKSESWK